MSAATRLSALDAGFLAAESAVTPLHVGSLSYYEREALYDADGRFRLSDIAELTIERLPLVPRFRQRLVEVPFGIGRPMWVDDPDFDIAHHVRMVTLPAPGTDVQLRDLCASLHTELLDRSRPLWQMWFVDGLADGRVALVEKIHHAMVDGVSSVDIAMAMTDPTPDPVRTPAPPWAPGALPGGVRMLAGALVEGVVDPLRVLRSGWGAVRHPATAIASARRLVESASTLVGRDAIAPRSSINRPIGRDRVYEVVQLSLGDVNAVRRELGATINDVVLAVVAGGFRRLLSERGELVDSRHLQAMVPVSLRSDGDHLTFGNRVGTILAPLPIGEPDPVARLRAVQDAMRTRKEHHQADASAALVDAVDHVPPPLIGAVARSIHHQPLLNVVVTNVPGPPMPLYLLGSRLLETYPVVPLARNTDVSVGIVSYDTQLTLGLFADSTTCPDVGVLAEGIEKSFVDLQQDGTGA